MLPSWRLPFVKNANILTMLAWPLAPSTRQTVRTIFNYPEARSKRPTAWLDGLRGIAAFEVLLYHWHIQFLGFDHNPAYGSREDTLDWWRLPYIRNFYHSGHAMVNVFFMISGFVLTQRSLSQIRAKKLDTTALSSAIFRRAMRIYLPCFAVTFVGVFLVYFKLKEMANAHPQDTLVAQIMDWLMACRDFAQPFHKYENDYELPHRYEAVMWTLPLEFYGSIVCYLTILGVSRVTSAVKRAGIVALLAWFAALKGNWWTFNFLVGMLHADFMLSEPEWTNTVAWKALCSVAFLWAFYVAGLPDAHYNDPPGTITGGPYNLPGFDWYYENAPMSWKGIEGGGRFWWMLSGITMTFTISQLPPLRRLFEITFVQWLGKISFMLYLIHSYFFEMVGRSWKNFLTRLFSHNVYSDKFEQWIPVFIPGGWLLTYVCFWLVMGPLVCAAAGQVTKHVDDRCIRFAKWLEEKCIEEDKEREYIPL